MVLPKDTEGYSYRFYKTLNEDVKLVSNEYGEWDIDFDNTNNDWINVSGFDSLVNACIIAVMTRFNEEEFIPSLDDNMGGLYEDFGCRLHELIKANKTHNLTYKLELFITETLNSIRRVKKVNWVKVEDNPNGEFYNYRISFSVTPMSDEDNEYGKLNGDEDVDVVERMFYI